jgi:hypothetical protein
MAVQDIACHDDGMRILSIVRMAIVALSGISLAACIESATPLLSDARPVFGDQVRFILYGLRDGAAHDPQTVSFRWNGSYYAVSGKRQTGVTDFTIHEFEGRDAILQTANVKKGQMIEYALARKLADGVYLFIALDKAGVDEKLTAALCPDAKSTICRVQTREQLLTFARANAAKPHETGGLAVRVPRR